LISKTRDPKWEHESIENVKKAEVDFYFLESKLDLSLFDD